MPSLTRGLTGRLTGSGWGPPSPPVDRPVNTVAPVITGVPTVGQLLTVSNGTWTGPGPITYAYQWFLDGILVVGATSSTFTPDDGQYLKVVTASVTATNSNGNASAAAAGVGPLAGYTPVITGTLAISGTTTVGQTLSFTAPTITGIPSATTGIQWKRGGVAISGATSSTYTLQAADVGTTITVTVSATNVYGSDSKTSAATATIAGTVPANTVLPVISGTTTVGQTLSTTTGTWTGIPTPTYTYQWKRNGTNISGATSSTYALVAADYNNPITVTVTATNSAGATGATSTATANIAGLAPVNTVAASITGVATVGSTLTAVNGTWTGVPTPTYTYQWTKNGVNISGATSSTYVPVSGDLAAVISVKVTGTNAVGNATSTATGVTIADSSADVSYVRLVVDETWEEATAHLAEVQFRPSLGGTMAAGTTIFSTEQNSLTQAAFAFDGDVNTYWSYSLGDPDRYIGRNFTAPSPLGQLMVTNSNEDSLAYQYALRSFRVQTSQNGTDWTTVLTVTDEPIWTTGEVRLYEINGGGSLTAPVNDVAGVISGNPWQGQTLSVSNGTWSGNPAPTFTYQWKKDGTDIGGATSSTFSVPGSGYNGSVVTVVVTGTNSQGSSNFTATGVTIVAQPVPVNSVAPVVSGGSVVGDTLTTTNGTWTNSPSSYAYKWQRDITSVWTDIGGATSSTYAPIIAGTYRSVVTASNGGGAGTPANSNSVVISAAGTAPTVVNSIAAESGAAPDATTTGAITTTTGNLAVVYVTWQDGTNVMPTITDSKGNTYTQVGTTASNTFGGYTYYVAAAIAHNITGGSGHTFTATKTNSYSSLVAVNVNGAATSSANAGYNAAADTASPYVTPSITPSANNCLLLAAINPFDATSVTPSGSFSNVTGVFTGWPLSVAKASQTTATAVTCSWTTSSSSQSVCAILAIKP